MPKTRDSQRSKVYASERSALRTGLSKCVTTFRSTYEYDDEGKYRFIPAREVQKHRAKMVKDAQKFVDRVLKRKYVIRHYGVHKIRVKGHKGYAFAWAYDWANEISLPFNGGSWAWHEDVLLHEIAHCLAHRKYRTPCHHDWRFAAIYLDLVRNVMGKEAADALKKEFRKNKVRFTEPKKRQISPERRKELQERAKEMRALRAAKEDNLQALKRRGYSENGAQPYKEVPTTKGLKDMTAKELQTLRDDLYEYDRKCAADPSYAYKKFDHPINEWERIIMMNVVHRPTSFAVVTGLSS